MQLNPFFNPHSVAVVGATNDPKKVGYALMKNILAGGVREVYPVTLGETTVFDRAVHTSLRMIPGPVELAVIAVRADIVPAILEECVEKDIHHVIVISAGFKEAGDAGRDLEERIRTIARERGIALLGPNCLGIMNAHADWNASFAVNKPRAGNIAFLSQSGALGTALLDWANKEGIGFSKFISLGNEASLSELEFLEYLAEDDDTKAVLLYLEKVSDGERFLEIAHRVTEKKPLVVLRAGRSTRGSAAVASHTGSIAPSDKVFSAALAGAGAVSVDSIRTLFSLAKLLELGIMTPLTQLAILTNGGGPSVNTADLIDLSRSLSLVTFSEETKKSMRAVLPPMAAVGNPIDVIGDAGADRYDKTLAILTEVSTVDAIIVIVTPQMMTEPTEIANVLLTHRSKKPIIPVFMGGTTVEPGVRTLNLNGAVSFDSPTDVVEALEALARGAAKPATHNVQKITHDTESLVMMPLEEMTDLLDNYDMRLAGNFAPTKEGVAHAAERCGEGPYVIKAISKELVHKSDLHAVELNLTNTDALNTAWDRIVSCVEAHTPGAVIDGMLVQKMVKGVETIIGMKRDRTFGPVIVFGLGGIFVEILKDVSMRIAPVSKEEALAQIREIKGLPLLTGARGTTPADLEALAKIITTLSQLSLDYPEIEEIDLNPVFATPTGAHIVDARVMTRRPH